MIMVFLFVLLYDFFVKNKEPLRQMHKEGTMTIIRNMIQKVLKRKITPKTQEQIRMEYETAKYDHYIAFGNAFMNFCSGK